jgi:hypothetical protein
MILRRIFRENAASPAIRLDNAMSCPKRVSSLPTSRSAINDISDREKLVVAQQLGSVHRLDARLQGPEMVVAKLGRRRLAFHTWHFAPASCFARGERPARLRVGLSVAAAGGARYGGCRNQKVQAEHRAANCQTKLQIGSLQDRGNSFTCQTPQL